VARLVGFDFLVPLGVEMIAPGEGEVTAAKRLLKSYDRFFDAVLADGIYLQGPFVDFCRECGKHVLVVLKDNNPALLGDARAIFEARAPEQTREKEGLTIRYWDVEGLQSGEAAANHPLRVVHTEEREAKRQRIGGQWLEETTEHNWWWATTIPQSLMPVRQIADAGHRRWGIENECFNQLSTHWALDHCFHHEPVAINNFILTCMIAFVLVESFYRLNLKFALRARFTLIAITQEILLGLTRMIGQKAPWLDPAPRPP
jgi:hypothetical protein